MISINKKASIFNRALFNLSIRQKLLLSFGLVVVIFLIAIIVNLVEQQHINKLMDDVLQREQKLRLIQTADYNVRKTVDDASWYMMSSSPKAGVSFLQSYKTSQASLSQDINTLKNKTQSQDSLKAINQFQKDWEIFQQRASQAIRDFQLGKQTKAQQLFTQDTVDHILNALNSDTKRQKQDIQQYETQLNAAKTSAFITNITLFLIVTCLALLLALLFARNMSRSIKRLRDVAHEIAEGNLTVSPLTVHSGDEVGQLEQATNTMLKNLKVLVQSVYSTIQELSASSHQLAASSEETTQSIETVTQAVQQIAGGSEEQSQNVEQTHQTMEEMSQGVQSIATMAFTVSEKANSMSEHSNHGNALMMQTLNKMNDVHAFVDQSSSIITNLNEHSREINKIVAMISDIAEQTNLLALNAAIEAARAGHEGNGFAVVADEVRKLAQQSQDSTDTINKIVDEIDHSIGESVEVMQNVKDSIKMGVDLMDETGSSFHSILESNRIVVEEIQDLSAVSQEISAGVQEVTHTITQFANISQQTSAELQNVSASTEEQNAAMQEVSSSAVILSNLANQLKVEVEKFKV